MDRTRPCGFWVLESDIIKKQRVNQKTLAKEENRLRSIKE